ncbi:MAG: hypothetical protein ISR62_05605 [Desulfobacteraceae bacterium]|nr:hypothetical protein [Desulfobacterales bacterium]MBL6967880.1 hypothetical protein [Desulfobacteraceae bacterium]MBL7101154.1 hypothetical protein [Desulfobacteraceae bacterium]MBL7173012.1 hypothetical protein [Desulfobacteraceae bacterium]
MKKEGKGQITMKVGRGVFYSNTGLYDLFKRFSDMPELSVIEQIPNPKDVLFEILREASGLTGRRLKRFNTDECRIRITGLVSDFSPLRQLSAFQRLENDISTLKQNGWVLDIGSETA